MSMSKFATTGDYYTHLSAIASGDIPNDKPTVHYSALIGEVAVGSGAVLVPVDHPYTDLNGNIAYTSSVVAYDEVTGRLETRNTVYVPVQH